MPATNPRITITLTPEVHQLLKRLSALTGNSQSSMVSDLLQESGPVLRRMLQVLEAAETLKAHAATFPAQLSDSLAAAQERLEGQLGLALGAMDEGFRPILEAGEAAGIASKVGSDSGGDRARGSRGRSPPLSEPASHRGATPMSNRGVRLTSPQGGSKRKGVR